MTLILAGVSRPTTYFSVEQGTGGSSNWQGFGSGNSISGTLGIAEIDVGYLSATPHSVARLGVYLEYVLLNTSSNNLFIAFSGSVPSMTGRTYIVNGTDISALLDLSSSNSMRFDVSALSAPFIAVGSKYTISISEAP